MEAHVCAPSPAMDRLEQRGGRERGGTLKRTPAQHPDNVHDSCGPTADLVSCDKNRQKTHGGHERQVGGRLTASLVEGPTWKQPLTRRFAS
jgi:hypothetical protein